MTFRTLMVLTSALLLASGLALSATPIGFALFYPQLPAAAASVGPATEPVWIGVSLMRLFGATLAWLGLIAWCTRGISSVEAQDAVARGVQYGGVIGFFVALAQEVTVLHSVGGALMVALFLGLVVGVVYWRVQHAKTDPYGAISVRV